MTSEPPKDIPVVLDAIADKVLAYRPKPRSQATRCSLCGQVYALGQAHACWTVRT